MAKHIRTVVTIGTAPLNDWATKLPMYMNFQSPSSRTADIDNAYLVTKNSHLVHEHFAWAARQSLRLSWNILLIFAI